MKEGKVLLLQDAPSGGEVMNFHEGKYGLPGGRIDPGERLYDGVKREMKEETGRDIEIVGTADCSDFVYDYNSESRHGILLVFYAKFVDTAKIILSNEHVSFDRFGLDDLDSVSIVPNQLQLIEDLLSQYFFYAYRIGSNFLSHRYIGHEVTSERDRSYMHEADVYADEDYFGMSGVTYTPMIIC